MRSVEEIIRTASLDDEVRLLALRNYWGNGFVSTHKEEAMSTMNNAFIQEGYNTTTEKRNLMNHIHFN